MGRTAVYPFADLEVGQCFTIPLNRVVAGTVNNLCYIWGHRLNRTFSYRTTATGYLVERLEDRTSPTFEITTAPQRRSRAQLQAEVDALARQMRDR